MQVVVWWMLLPVKVYPKEVKNLSDSLWKVVRN